MKEIYFLIFLLIVALQFMLFCRIHFAIPESSTSSKFNKLSVQHYKPSSCNPILPGRAQFSIKIDGVAYPKSVPRYHNKSINFTCLNSTRAVPTILLWTNIYEEPFDKPVYGVGEQFKRNNCPVTNCEFTNDKQKLNRSDLVLFHIRNRIAYIPKRAFPTQRYVHMIYEPPIHCHLCDKFEDSVFNYSATHSSESDYSSIYWTNSGLYWEPNESFDANKNRTVDKMYPVAALISNCQYEITDRLSYIHELNKFIPVKIYGGCGQKCPNSSSCKSDIARDFKFYLSFENSACKGYITEKFFDWFNYDIVPVVLGLGDYSHYIPKSGYINVFDFGSPRELGEYLSYLDRNSTAYNAFFSWKRYIKTEFFEQRHMMGFLCEMCIQLHMENLLGYVEKKELTHLKARFGVIENCGKGKIEENGTYSMHALDEPIYSYFLGD
jgi:hypothetical protein